MSFWPELQKLANPIPTNLTLARKPKKKKKKKNKKRKRKKKEEDKFARRRACGELRASGKACGLDTFIAPA